MLCFLQIGGKTLHHQNDHDLCFCDTHFTKVVWNGTHNISSVYLLCICKVRRTGGGKKGRRNVRESEEERKVSLGDKKNSNNLSESYWKNIQEMVGAYKTK